MTNPPRLLPPSSRPGDWVLGGVAAGLVLAVAEAGLALLVEDGFRPPRLAMALGAATVLLVALPSALVGLAVRRARASTLVGALVGAIVAAPMLGALAQTLTSRPDASLPTLLGLLVAVMAGGLAAWLASRMEQRLLFPVPALPVWGGAALLVAAGERHALLGLPGSASWRILAAALIVGLASPIAVRLAARRLRAGRTWLGRAVVAAALLYSAIVWTPTLWPWLQLEPRPLGEEAQASALVVLLPGRVDGPRDATSELLRAEGLRYERIDRGATEAGWTLANGRPLLARLGAAGWSTAVVGVEARLPDAGANELIAIAGSGRLLERQGPAAAGGGLLIALSDVAPSLVARLRVSGVSPPPAEMTGAAVRWLVGRGAGSRAPFFLIVDYRDASWIRGDEAPLARLLGSLDQLGAAPSTWVVAIEERDPTEGWRATLRPPLRMSAEGVGTRVTRQVPLTEFLELLAGLPWQELDSSWTVPLVRRPSSGVFGLT